MIIRTMTADDYERVYELWISCTGMGLNNLDDSKEGIEKFLKRNPDTCFVAELNGIAIGTILAGNDGRRGYIYHTAVSPDFRNKGIASRLADRAVLALADCGITKIALAVFDKNEDGNSFWENKGFAARNDIVFRIKNVCDTVDIDT